eukprot:m.126424 g.126424  ORF g.126424 m.126424 type:complete len:884 (-) comp29200_c0_seq7:99-2750(-)
MAQRDDIQPGHAVPTPPTPPTADDICRICRSGGLPESPLFYPCGCAGSIKYIHQECLQTWLQHSQKRKCEVCEVEYKFIAVYSKDMPKTLPFRELASGIYTFSRDAVQSWSRMAIVAFCWGIIFPIVARWTWQLFFEEWLFPWEKEDAVRRLAWDCAQGSCIGLVVFCLTLGLLGLRDFIVANGIAIGDPLGALDPEVVQVDVNNNQDLDAPDMPHLEDLSDMDDSETEEADSDRDRHSSDYDSDVTDHEIDEGLFGDETDFIDPVFGDEPVDDLGDLGDNPDWHMNDEVPLEELFGLVGPLNRLFDNMVWVIMINALAIFAFAFIPHLMGATVYSLLGWPTESPVMFVLTGYVVVVIMAFGYLGATDPNDPSPFHRILTFQCVFVKVCALLTCEVILCPLMAGWWLDICGLELQNSTLRDHKVFFNTHPWTSSFLHWFVGMLFMHNFASFLKVLRDMLRQGVLWFFRDPNDPDFHPLKQMLELELITYIRRLLLITVMYGVLIVMLVWLPVKTVCSTFPSVLPFQVMLSHPLEVLAFNFAIPLIQDYCNPSDSFENAVKMWLKLSSYVLGITKYMFPHNETDGETAPTPAEMFPKFFSLRILGLLGLGWLTSHVLVTALLTIPVTVGRYTTNAAFLEVHDLYTFVVGVFVCWVLVQIPRKLSKANVLRAVHTTLSMHGVTVVYHVVVHAIKGFVAVMLVLIVLPTLAGLLVDLVIIIPAKCPVEMTPILSLWQDWSIGVMVLKLIYQSEYDGPANIIANWRNSIDSALNSNLGEIPLKPLLNACFHPVLILSTALLMPYLVTHSETVHNNNGQRQTTMMYRYMYPMLIVIVMARVAAAQASEMTMKIVHVVRDNKYLIGKRLVNVDNTVADDSVPTPPAATI